jgi:endo-1,4-beta-xylanase
MGTVTSDGGTYNIYKHQQVNQPSIQGTTTFWHYLAIRTSPTGCGTITFQNFVKSWASHGMNLGTMNCQAVAAAAAPQLCWPGRLGAAGTTSTSRPPAPTPGP